MMHIGFIVSHYPTEPFNNDGGLGTSVYNLVKSLKAKGHTTSVFVYSQAEDFILEDKGHTIYSIKKKIYPFLSWLLYRRYLNTFINKIIKKKRIEVIEAPDWTGITAFMKLLCPLVIRLHGTDGYFCDLDQRKQKFKNRILEKLALSQADHILSVSHFAAEKTKDIFNLKRTITVIPNGINLVDFKPSEQVDEYAPPSVLYFGSIIRKKGVLELPYIFNHITRHFPDCKFVVIGSDVKDHITGQSTILMMQNAMTTLTESNTSWLGRLPYHTIKEQLEKATVIVLPSYAEAFPMTWLEAMALERPLVTSNIGWAHELMINGETGFTEDPKNHKEYSKKVLRLLRDSALRSQMGKAARHRILKHFDIALIAERNIAYYKRISQ